jgi:solute carrier family 8 (sodium/calcium exchanger)
MAGASISKILLVFRHMGLAVFSIQTYFRHQRHFVFPSIFYYWKTYRKSLIDKVKGLKRVERSGDGRFDSMGHSAKYGVYTMLCTTLMKVVHFEIVQVSFLANSSNFIWWCGTVLG